VNLGSERLITEDGGGEPEREVIVVYEHHGIAWGIPAHAGFSVGKIRHLVEHTTRTKSRSCE
jgi:hypothetical protein